MRYHDIDYILAILATVALTISERLKNSPSIDVDMNEVFICSLITETYFIYVVPQLAKVFIIVELLDDAKAS